MVVAIPPLTPAAPVTDQPSHSSYGTATYRRCIPTTSLSPSKFIAANLEGDVRRDPCLDRDAVEQCLHFRLPGRFADLVQDRRLAFPEFIQFGPIVEIGPIPLVKL